MFKPRRMWGSNSLNSASGRVNFLANNQFLYGVEFWNSKNIRKYYFLQQTRQKEKVFCRYKRRYITGTREGRLQVQEKVYYRYKRR